MGGVGGYSSCEAKREASLPAAEARVRPRTTREKKRPEKLPTKKVKSVMGGPLEQLGMIYVAGGRPGKAFSRDWMTILRCMQQVQGSIVVGLKRGGASRRAVKGGCGWVED